MLDMSCLEETAASLRVQQDQAAPLVRLVLPARPDSRDQVERKARKDFKETMACLGRLAQWVSVQTPILLACKDQLVQREHKEFLGQQDLLDSLAQPALRV